jgi:hypothetical protein
VKANKIILNNEVLIDLTADTVTQNDVKKGVTFHGRDGVEYEGTYEVALQSKRVTPTKEKQSITPDAEYEGFSEVVVEAIPDNYVIPEGTATFDSNGTYDVSGKKTVIVDVVKPVEIATADEMNALLTNPVAGAIYKYTGESTDVYEHNALYIVEGE